MSRDSLTSLFTDFYRFRSDPAMVWPRGYRRHTCSYERLAVTAAEFADMLRSRGIQADDRVLLWAPNCGEWVAAFWACQLLGAVAVPMDDSATADFAARVAGDAQVKLIVANRSKPRLDSAIPALAMEDLSGIAAKTSVVVPQTGAQTVPRGTSSKIYESIAPELRKRGHLAEILFTSGTTAEPRGVLLTHGNFLANLEPIERGLQKYRKYERLLHPLKFVSLVPLSHVFGQFMVLFVPPLLGATVVFENSPNPAEILRTVKRERATVLVAVPRMLDLVRSALEREIDSRGWRAWFDKNYASAKTQPFLRRAWRFRRIHRLLGYRFWAFISGGAALAPDTELFFKRLGFAVVQGYGMTETASLISLNHPFSAAEGSVGKVLPGREFKLADDGEILVRGENVSAGYWQQGASNETPYEGGWLRTGDLGEFDAQGNLKFRGRKKNVIVTPAGLNIYPEDLEAALKKQPAIRDAVVIPIDCNGNSEPCAVLLPTTVEQSSGLPGDASKISFPIDDSLAKAVAAANAALGDHQQIRQWRIWPEPDYPRTPTGKPRQAAMVAALFPTSTKDAATGPNRVPADPLTRLISADASLTSLSSLDRVELLSAIEQRYNIEISESVFTGVNSLGDLQKIIAQSQRRANDQEDSGPAKPVNRYHYPRWAQAEVIRYFRLFVYYLLVWPATQILAHPKIIGRQNLDGLNGPAIVVCNHITRRADMGLILAALPARFRHHLVTAMGGESLQRMRTPPREWFFGKRWGYRLGYWLVTALFNVFPLPQFSGFRQSFRFAGESADRGYSVLIFPEGEVNNSADGRMAPFQSGIGVLAENLALPIVPMRLDGVWQMKRQRRRLARPDEITVHIGSPVKFPPNTPPQEIAAQLQALVAAL